MYLNLAQNVGPAVLAMLVALVATGCSLQKLTVDQTAEVLYAGQPALEREPDVQFARDAFPASLKTVESFLISSPDNEKMLEMLGKGYYSYAFGFLEWDFQVAQFELAAEDEIDARRRRAIVHYLRARDYGFQLLDKPKLRRAAFAGDEDVVAAELKKLDQDDVRGLFWAGYGWGSAINLSQDDPDMVAALGVVEMMMERCVELDEHYFYGGAHLFFGVLYAGRPEMFGGDPEKARRHYDRALELYGDENLMISYLKARYYATQVQDRDLFVTLLQQVVSAPVAEHPDLRLNNEIARKRARFWLEHVDDLIFQ